MKRCKGIDFLLTVLLNYQIAIAETGRWDENLDENERIISASVTDGTDQQFAGKCVIVYRLRPEVKFEMKELVEARISTFIKT